MQFRYTIGIYIIKWFGIDDDNSSSSSSNNNNVDDDNEERKMYKFELSSKRKDMNTSRICFDLCSIYIQQFISFVLKYFFDFE